MKYKYAMFMSPRGEKCYYTHEEGYSARKWQRIFDEIRSFVRAAEIDGHDIIDSIEAISAIEDMNNLEYADTCEGECYTLKNNYPTIFDNVRRFDSSDERVFKYVFASDDGVAEAVLYRYPTFEERTVICCSTQSGCPVGCSFCGTGKKFIRNLTADEIIGQIKYIFDDQNIDTKNVEKLQIMFMSMGEPMLNIENVDAAVRILNSRYENAQLLLSTIAPRCEHNGAWPKLLKLSQDIDNVGLQFSVHASLDSVRNGLIPYKGKYTLQELANTGNLWYEATGRQPFCNYCATEENITDEDADRLRELFDPKVFQFTVSVVCEKDETVARAEDRQKELTREFCNKLLERGFSVRVFDPAGQDDIGGGCGQLWYVQEWYKNHNRS